MLIHNRLFATWLLVASGLLCCFVSFGLGQDAARVTAARRLIESERTTILFAMHPTGKLSRLQYDGVTPVREGFVLAYTFQFNGLLGAESTQIDLAFTNGGTFTGVTTKETTALVDPFTATDLALGLFKDIVAEDLELKKDGLMKKALDAADAKLILEAYLAYKHSTARSAGPGDTELIQLILGSESMDDKERKYWIDLLPRMNANDRGKLRQILIDEKRQLAAIDKRYKDMLDGMSKANALFDKKDYKGAITEATAAIAVAGKSVEAYYLRGQAYQLSKQYAEAIADFTRVIDLVPKAEAPYRWRASGHRAQGNYGGVFVDYSRRVEVAPRNPGAWNDLAWLLATCPQARFRDGKEAVKHATQACELTGWKKGFYMDTLAAAYAEQGDFDNAVQWQTKALADSAFEKVAGKEEIARARVRLELFKKKTAYREP